MLNLNRFVRVFFAKYRQATEVEFEVWSFRKHLSIGAIVCSLPYVVNLIVTTVGVFNYSEVREANLFVAGNGLMLIWTLGYVVPVGLEVFELWDDAHILASKNSSEATSAETEPSSSRCC
jgi:hypothetical protein